jgi:hypothetical protein
MINSIKLLQVNNMAMRYCNWNGWDNDMSQIVIQVYKMISLLDQFLLGIKLSQYHKIGEISQVLVHHLGIILQKWYRDIMKKSINVWMLYRSRKNPCT